MISIDFQNECCGCSACAQICQRGCVSMAENSDGFLIPKIDAEKCTGCNLCEKVCPVFNSKTEMLNNNIPQNVYAAYSKNEDIRLKSSSGGIFSILAEYTIKKGGAVFGARLSDDCKLVYHCMIDSIEDISLFRGSKYVQSDINNTYKEVRKQIETGRFVLFSGTPCQIEGLALFLQKEYENLFLIDVICHGVPSPKVWRKYLEHFENKHGKPLTVLFRDKSSGWHGGRNVYISLQNGKASVDTLEDNLYISAFVTDLCLRPSCYNCKFRKANRISDMTIGDFWGIDEVAPDMNDNKGISAMIIHSQKGEKLFEDINNELIFQKADFGSVEKNNLILRQPKLHKNRERFYKNLDTVDIEKNIKKNIHQHSKVIRISYKIVKVCLRTVLGNKNFNNLKMWLKNI